MEIDDLEREIWYRLRCREIQIGPCCWRHEDVIAVREVCQRSLPFGDEKTAHCHSCLTAPRSHMTLTTIFSPLRLLMRSLSSSNAPAIAFTESEGLRTDEVSMTFASGNGRLARLTASSLQRKAVSANTQGLEGTAALTGDQEDLLLGQDNCEGERAKRKTASKKSAPVQQSRTVGHSLQSA